MSFQTTDGTFSDDTFTLMPGQQIINGRFGTDTLVLDLHSDAVRIEFASTGRVSVFHDGGTTLTSSIEIFEFRDTTLTLLSGRLTLPEALTGRDIAELVLGNAARPDTIIANGGEDYVVGGFGDDFLDGGADNDRIFGGRDNDTLLGGQGADVLEGGGQQDSLSGGIGNDTLRGNKGEDTLQGGDGNDQLFGQRNADVLSGGAGNDRLNGAVARTL